MMRRSYAVAALVLALGGGCGDHHMAAPPDMARGPLDHPPLWRLGRGTGPIQPAAEVWTVVWQGDEVFGAQVVDFLDWMLHSDYWKTTLGEYGIGTGVSKGLIVLPMAAPAAIDDAELGLLAANLVTTGQIINSVNTSVAFLPPTTTTVTAGADTSCQIFAGYHSYGSGSPDATAYSVNMRCAGEPGDAFDGVTRVLSHEVAETATDPVPRSSFVDNSPGGQEIGDLCEFGLNVPIDVAPDATHPARRYWVQRQYSDARAADGTIDPCLPLPWDHPYWNIALDPPLIDVAAADSDKAIHARLDVFAYGDVGIIKWFASSSADVQPAGGEVHAGDTIDVAITPSTSLGAGSSVEVDIIAESEKAGSQMWFGYVLAH
jgi:hypothetical protein